MPIAAHELEIVIPAGSVSLPGTLTAPAKPIGVVLFAHGSGSGRMSPRNRAVAGSLVNRSCATLLFDLLSPQEALDRRNVFDIPLLAQRVLAGTQWLRSRDELNGHDALRDLPIGYFGASTGAAAALVAAAELRGGREESGGSAGVAAVVSRGGRPDLAGDALPGVTAPTLLLVGSLDEDVLELNRRAQQRMRCESRLVIIPGATHLFEEPGTLEEVARLAGEWFVEKFRMAATNKIARS